MHVTIMKMLQMMTVHVNFLVMIVLFQGSIGPDIEYGLWNENCECIFDNSNLNSHIESNKIIRKFDILGRNTNMMNKIIFELNSNGLVEKKLFIE